MSAGEQAVATDRERACLVALATVPGIGPATLARCRVEGGAEANLADVVRGRAGRSPVLVAAASSASGTRRDAEVGAAVMARAAAALDPPSLLARHRAAGHVLLPEDPGFPSRLTEGPSLPALLFAAGDLAALDRRSVAVIGTRNATRSGRVLAAELAEGLSRAGVAVVSGLALGIDGSAHQAVVDLAPDTPGAPDGGLGPPIGVIASGLDIAYPRWHRDLHRSVVDRGLLLSETPLGGRPLRWRFPARNRLIAGLAEAVVVVESRSVGGSMLTAAEALDRGIPVLAVPGHPTSPSAAGTIDLLFDGAWPVRDVDDVLGAIGLAPSAPAARAPIEAPVADPDQAAVLEILGVEARSFDELVHLGGLTLDRTATALAELEVTGLVVRRGPWCERAATTASAPRRRGAR